MRTGIHSRDKYGKWPAVAACNHARPDCGRAVKTHSGWLQFIGEKRDSRFPSILNNMRLGNLPSHLSVTNGSGEFSSYLGNVMMENDMTANPETVPIFFSNSCQSHSETYKYLSSR